MSFLYPEQDAAVQKMKNGCILNGDVGSGKSRTGLYYYFEKHGGVVNDYKFKRMVNPKNLYIITTAMKRDSMEWEKELSYYRLDVKTDNNYKDYKIIIDSWNNIQKYNDIKDSFFIFDEDRVTGKGAWVKTFLKITKNNEWIILSATPGDTWEQYIPVFIANGFYKNRTEFEREHCIFSPFIRNYKKIDRYVGCKKLMRLKNSILVDIEDRRIAEHISRDVVCDYDRDLYRKIMKERWDIYKNEPIQQASSLCYVLRRLVNSDKSRLENLDLLIRSIRGMSENEREFNLYSAMGMVVNTNRRFIIFYNFDYELELLKEHLSKEFPFIPIREWNGHKHEEIYYGPEWFYLVQYNAGCEGWNCIKSNQMIFFSQNYSYKMMKQAAGRIDRINTQYQQLYYYYLRSSAPIDMAIKRAFKNKKDFNERKFIND